MKCQSASGSILRGVTHGLAQRMAFVFVSFADNATLIELSRDLWNGNLARTQEIVAKDFVAHPAPITASGVVLVAAASSSVGWTLF